MASKLISEVLSLFDFRVLERIINNKSRGMSTHLQKKTEKSTRKNYLYPNTSTTLSMNSHISLIYGRNLFFCICSLKKSIAVIKDCGINHLCSVAVGFLLLPNHESSHIDLHHMLCFLKPWRHHFDESIKGNINDKLLGRVVCEYYLKLLAVSLFLAVSIIQFLCSVKK